MSPDIISALVNGGAAGAVILVVWLNQRFNEKRDVHQNKSNEKRDQEWRDFFTTLNTNNKADIGDMRATAAHMTSVLDQLANMYSQHDTRAIAIQQKVEAIKVDIERLTRMSGKSAD